jgi:uncharacterized protein YfdQ (DUF2303 family)
MSENNVIETFLQNGGAALQKVSDVAAPAIVIGASQKVENLEKLLAAPLRINETRRFDDLRGFVEYANTYKQDGSSAFASRERIQVVFDYHGPASPHWCSHAIEFFYKRSTRWQLWEKHNNVWMSQEDFADFLDSGLEEITYPVQADVLELVKNFRSTVNAEAHSQIGPDGTHFSYQQTVRGSAKKTDITIPEFLTIRVSPFNGLEVLNALLKDEMEKIPTYAFRAKFSFRMQKDEAKPDFKLQLLNFDQAIDETLESVRTAIKALTGIQTYIGG